jgi:RNA polymerase sigma factor (sigma-70 family)
VDGIETVALAERVDRVRAAQRGDVAAFASLVQQHEPALRRFCQRLMCEAVPAQDLAQETLLRAFQALPRLEDPTRFEAWLFGIAANIARKMWHRRTRAPISLDRIAASSEPLWQGRPMWLPGSPTSPEHVYEQAEQARRLMDAIGSLPAQLRHTVILHYVEDLSYVEVAEAMKVPVTTVKGWLHKSRTRLRRTLGDEARAASAPRQRPGAFPRDTRLADRAGSRKESGAMANTRDTGARPEPSKETATAWWEALGTVVPTLFGENTIASFRAAEEEARRWQHHYLGTEHLLLGLVRDEQGIPAKVLAGLGAPPNEVRTALEYRVGRGDQPSPPQLGVAPRARITLELAREDMRFLKHERIEPEHLLLGLVQVPQGIAALILESRGVSLARVRADVLSAIPLDEASPRFYWSKAAASPKG